MLKSLLKHLNLKAKSYYDYLKFNTKESGMMSTKEIVMALSVSALLVGCVDSSTGAAARADMEGETTKVEAKAEVAPAEAAPAVEAAAPVEEAAPVAAEKATPAETPAAVEAAAPAEETAPVAEEAAPAAAVNLSACGACHGANFENAAMGVSKIVKDMSQEEIVAALKGYKAGTYGGAMKGVMQGQVAAFDDAMIEAAAAQIKQ